MVLVIFDIQGNFEKKKKKRLNAIKGHLKTLLTFHMTEDMESEIHFCNQNMKDSCSKLSKSLSHVTFLTDLT